MEREPGGVVEYGVGGEERPTDGRHRCRGHDIERGLGPGHQPELDLTHRARWPAPDNLGPGPVDPGGAGDVRRRRSEGGDRRSAPACK